MAETDFLKANHTIVVSDIHLADAEPPHPSSPLWKRYKRSKYFVDKNFKAFLEYVQKNAEGPIELILNGDIFDFDAVMVMPKDPTFSLSWIEKLRGLSSEERKSRFKIKLILDDHPVWIEAIRQFILAGNKLIFIIGNHDMELHWPRVRADVVERLGLPESCEEQIRFCEWFYISNQDTLVEHGNQYDSYCLCSNPIHPLIKKGSRVLVRLPFGNLAGKYMINGMGLMNPHATGTYIKNSVWEYLVFYYKYMMRVQPFLLWTWFWSAFVTLGFSISEGFLPALSDPITLAVRIEDIAKRSNAEPGMVIALKEVHVHPAIFDPLKILRELWLDRAILLLLIFLGSFQLVSFLTLFTNASLFWIFLPIGLLMPVFIFYARSIQSEVDRSQLDALQLAPLCGKITRVKRIIQGHTHLEVHTAIEGVEVINTGTWSPAYHDVECTEPFGRKCFAWIRPKENSTDRYSELYEWQDSGPKLIQRT